MSRQPETVSVEAAYRAAEERAVKTTRALIIAEAQVSELQARLEGYERAQQCGEPGCACMEEVGEDGAFEGTPEAVGAVVPEGPVPA